MDSNGFYYTLSTIAQTLAGAFAFLVAVVLYRLEAIKEGRPGLQKELDQAKNGRSQRYGNENLLQQWQEKVKKCEEALQDADNMSNIIRC
jgi:hypothetical protein